MLIEVTTVLSSEMIRMECRMDKRSGLRLFLHLTEMNRSVASRSSALTHCSDTLEVPTHRPSETIPKTSVPIDEYGLAFVLTKISHILKKKEDKAPMSLKARRHQFQSSANYKALSLWIDCSWKTFININVWAYFICGFFIHLIFRWLFPKSHDFKWIIVEQTAQKWLVLSLAGDWAILRTLESLLRHKWPLLLAAKFGEISLRNWRKRNWRIIDAETDSSSTPESLFENVFIEARTNAGWTRFMIFFSLYFYKWIEIKIVFVPDCYLSRRFETKIFLSSICSNRKSMTVLFNLLFRCVSFTLLLMLLPRTSVEELLYR